MGRLGIDWIPVDREPPPIGVVVQVQRDPRTLNTFAYRTGSIWHTASTIYRSEIIDDVDLWRYPKRHNPPPFADVYIRDEKAIQAARELRNKLAAGFGPDIWDRWETENYGR